MNGARAQRPPEVTRIGFASAIRDVIEDLGGNASAIIGRAGLTLEALSDPDNGIPSAAFERLLRQAAEATGCDHIGFLLGQRAATTSIGYVGLLMRHSPDLRSALAHLVRYVHLYDDRGVVILELDKEAASLGYTAFGDPNAGAWDFIDASIALQFNMLRHLCGPSWRPIEVLLPRQRPRTSQPFDRFFEAPVRFGAEHGLMVFSSDWLAHPISGADPLVYQLVEERVAQLDAQASHGVESQIRRLLRTLVLSRRCSLTAAAQLLNTGPRTLARRLERERISFRAVADEVRYEVARHLLADTSLSMTQIALFLDYSEASAFARAFHRWSGIAPTAWRALDPAGRDARSGGSSGGGHRCDVTALQLSARK